MKLFIDLHIHSALSPCGDNDMTPNNIINMSILKGLDVIAITDHNSVENCKACMEVAQNKNIFVIPGMELQTKEEIHLICLFKDMDSAYTFQQEIYEKLPKEKNRSEFFGKQLVLDAEDKTIEENTRLLISSANITMKEAYEKVTALDGVVIPAHVDKNAYSLIYNLGFIPFDIPFTTLEISKNSDIENLKSKYRFLGNYQLIKNSDAHYLWDILEKDTYIEVQEKNIFSIFEALKNTK